MKTTDLPISEALQRFRFQLAETEDQRQEQAVLGTLFIHIGDHSAVTFYRSDGVVSAVLRLVEAGFVKILRDDDNGHRITACIHPNHLRKEKQPQAYISDAIDNYRYLLTRTRRQRAQQAVLTTLINRRVVFGHLSTVQFESPTERAAVRRLAAAGFVEIVHNPCDDKALSARIHYDHAIKGKSPTEDAPTEKNGNMATNDVLLDFGEAWADLAPMVRAQVSAVHDGEIDDYTAGDIEHGVRRLHVAVAHLRAYPAFIAPLFARIEAVEKAEEDALAAKEAEKALAQEVEAAAEKSRAENGVFLLGELTLKLAPLLDGTNTLVRSILADNGYTTLRGDDGAISVVLTLPKVTKKGV